VQRDINARRRARVRATGGDACAQHSKDPRRQARLLASKVHDKCVATFGTPAPLCGLQLRHSKGHWSGTRPANRRRPTCGEPALIFVADLRGCRRLWP
jgi:hypothetical protein